MTLMEMTDALYEKFIVGSSYTVLPKYYECLIDASNFSTTYSCTVDLTNIPNYKTLDVNDIYVCYSITTTNTSGSSRSPMYEYDASTGIMIISISNSAGALFIQSGMARVIINPSIVVECVPTYVSYTEVTLDISSVSGYADLRTTDFILRRDILITTATSTNNFQYYWYDSASGIIHYCSQTNLFTSSQSFTVQVVIA